MSVALLGDERDWAVAVRDEFNDDDGRVERAADVRVEAEGGRVCVRVAELMVKLPMLLGDVSAEW